VHPPEDPSGHRRERPAERPRVERYLDGAGRGRRVADHTSAGPS
jgi:hypothetical protein